MTYTQTLEAIHIADQLDQLSSSHRPLLTAASKSLRELASLLPISLDADMVERDYLLLASYCGDDNVSCTDRRPCAECLAMCNVFRVADSSPEYLREFCGPSASPTDAGVEG